MRRHRYIGFVMMAMLLLGGMVNQAWAAKVTYHILTLPITSDYHMRSAVTGHRLEAVKVVVDKQTTVELPAQYKSPLATGFTYYAPSSITIGSTEQIYQDNDVIKGTIYDVKGGAEAVSEGTVIAGNTAEYYVVYTYNSSNNIVKLDSSVNYNIAIKNKGFLSLNRGRNNRAAVIPKGKVDPEMLANEDFSRIENPEAGITTYWQSGDNKNIRAEVEFQFHFIFRFEGMDPYNIIIRSAYNRDITYIEKNEDTKDYVYKWYKGSALIVPAGLDKNAYIASDDHVKYTTPYDKNAASNPTNPAHESHTGYFHGNNSYWGSFALFNNSTNDGFLFMGTRTVDGNGAVPTPGNDNKYYYLKFDNNALTINKLTAVDATKSYSVEGIYPLKKVTFKVSTPFYKVTASEAHIVSVFDWVSQYTVDNDPIETKYLPAALKRKYCNFNGKFYKDAAHTKEITHFSDATEDPTEGYQVYVGYDLSASLPFNAVTPAASYDSATWADATWYELTDENSTQVEGVKLKYDGTNFKNNGAANTYEKQSEFAFIGDPYELQVVYRNTTSNSTVYYVGAAGSPTTGTLLTASTSATAGYVWQMPNDAPTGSFLLQKYKGEGNWYWDAGHPSPVAIAYGTKAHTYNVSTANAQTVTFNISGLTYKENYYITVTAGGTNEDQVTVPTDKIDVQSGGTASFTASIKSRGGSDKQFTLSIQEYNASDVTQGSPAVITVNQNVSTYTGNTVQYSTASSTRIKVMELPKYTYIYNIVDTAGNIAVKGTANQTIFTTLSKATIPSAIFSPFLVDETVNFYSSFTAGSRSNLSGSITETPVTNNADIYVSYTTSHLSSKSIKLNDEQQFNVQLNGEYIYWDGSKVASNVAASSTDFTNTFYLWRLEGGDPYAMKICNVGLEEAGEAKYVKVTTWANNTTLNFDASIANASRFVAMLSNYGGVYEVLAASGTTDYYHIGRPSTENAEVKIYDNATYAHGADQLRFELAGKDPIRYTLIDQNGDSIITLSSNNPRLVLPADFISPLVDTYYYYPTKAKALTRTGNITELAEDDGDSHVWVRYTVNKLIEFNNTGRVNDHPYLLKFLDPLAEGYYLEDGNDKLTTGKLKAIYPYCNGDGNLNIYGEVMRDEQMNGGSSTRPRWVWFFESANNDPYHVKIHSRSTISYNGVGNPTYLETKAVHFNQDLSASTKHIVTGGLIPGAASAEPTEYMILGIAGAYKLVTTNAINDGITTERRTVTSFEQYWKTYNMLKLHVLGVSANTDNFSDDNSTWVVPDSLRATLNTKLTEKGIGSGNWHSFDAYANAVRWNGYNDKTSGHEKKIVEKIEHWFQTFNMGNGTFDVESADIPPVLVLLDRHGWEIMRKPLPTTNYPEGDEELAALRAYDSPLVDRYYFYSNATKATGCHKYTLRMQDGKERDQIKVNGVHYSSTSLGDLPPENASGVKSSGVLNDQFVIYTVKEEYEKSYTYNFVDNGNGTYTESGTGSKFLMLQNGRFARDNGGTGDRINYLTKPIHEASNPVGGNVYDMIFSPNQVTVSNVSTNVDDNKDGKIDDINLWYLLPNLNIDKEMGIKWAAVAGGSSEPMTEYETKKAYKDKTGFDPYNIQLKNAGNNTFYTTHITSTKLDNGIMVADYSGEGDSDGVTLEAWVDVKNTDTSTPKRIEDEIVDEGYDHTNLKITNQTFMAVSDANGNMQLMPRFDHTKRINVTTGSSSHTTLQDPVNHSVASADNNTSMGPQTVFLVRPQRFVYHIIDNYGREALRYARNGDFSPDITEHFKSPLAKDFTYYKGLAESGDTVASTVEAWAAATGEFKRTANNIDSLYNLKNLLPTAGTYQYRVGTRGNFKYYSIDVTKGLGEQQITGTFAKDGYTDDDCDVYVRYNYDEEADLDADRILQGQWFTVKLANKDLQADGTIVTTVGPTLGTGVHLYSDAASPTKPGTIDANAKKWQWKFRTAPADPSSDYYNTPDPYAVQLFNRQANYTTNPSSQPSPMAVGIKVPNDNSGFDRFAILSHPNGGYALAVAKTYSDFNYPFLNGADMTDPDAGTPIAADTAMEASFTYKNGIISADAQVTVTSDVVYHYIYNVITDSSKLAVTAAQNNADASAHEFLPYLPDSAQSPLLNMDDYVYYGFARKNPGKGTLDVIEQTKLYTLYGLYDDTVYVRYGAYNMDKTNYKIPNEKTIVDSHVARGTGSHDVSMSINGGLPYNIIWYNDKMMSATGGTTISYGENKNLTGKEDSVWYFMCNDPYALKIKHKSGKYINGTTTLVDSASALDFMLLRKTGYDYGILQVTGTTGANAGKKLTNYGNELTANANTAPTKFIIFGLSVHDLIYRLIIAKSCPDKAHPGVGEYVDIPYREGRENTYTSSYEWSSADTTRIFGTSQRNLTAKKDDNEANLPGSKYQLGDTIRWGGVNHTYSYDAGSVSIGDDLWVPNEFYRPNCTFEFYIEGIYSNDGSTSETGLDNRFRGLKLDKLMSASELIDKTVVVNIVYKFDTTLATNTGLGFVTSTDQNLWYTFETQKGTTPYLAHYTNAWGLQAMEGAETRYTNDYLWTPLGDPYGFKMYNRYMLKNSGGNENVMTMNNIAEGKNLYLAVPGTTVRPEGEEGEGTPIPEDYGIFELVVGNVDGYFRVHPMVNTGTTKYYVKRSATDFAVLSTSTSDSTDWAFGLDMTLLEPYYQRAGYVGGLTAAAKTAYETVLNREPFHIIDLQNIVYADSNIVHFTPGYYRLHNQPDVSGISPVRYASGYLHEIEKTAQSGGIPMHFYSKAGVSSSFAGEDGLVSGFTVTDATRGEIPIDSTEIDPSTIFYFPGGGNLDGNPRSIMQTQGLYVAANANGDAANGTTTSKKQRAVMSENIDDTITFSLMDIGGAVLLIHDGAAPATRRYLNYDQSKADSIYDLKFYHDSPTDDAKWCMQPVQKTTTAGNGEMPLVIATNNGGDGYYYATFYAPFDVLLPNDKSDSTYNAYICKKWYNEGVNPSPVPAKGDYLEGKFIPAGTPVIIRVKDESGHVTLTLPSTSPSQELSCVFTGSYLEQILDNEGGNVVYSMGLPFTSPVTMNPVTGDITAELPEQANSGVGFYINANPNKEHNALQSLWLRNNRYVLHNKIYYRAPSGPSLAPEHTPDVQFVPVDFGDGEEEKPGEEQQGDDRNERVGDGCAYDILGRKVATAAEVKAGTWYQRLQPGVYIVDGQKMYVGY